MPPSRRRHSRRAGRFRLLALLGFLAAVATLAIVASSAGTGSVSPPPGPAAQNPHARAGRPRVPRTRPHADPAAALAAADVRAIDQVLAYTPFIRAGVPRHLAIALTFDDGPSPYTPGIVQTLVRMHVPATFFVVGQQLNDFAGALRDELRAGFAIGDHTENHAYMTRLTSAAQYGQIHDAAVRINRLGVPFPRLYRPPYGAYDANTLATVRQFKMLMVLWSVDTRDYTRPGTAAIVQSVLAGARPGGIVLMHDGGGDRSQTAAALPAIIEGLRRRHYELVTVPQLLRLDPPPRGQKLARAVE